MVFTELEAAFKIILFLISTMGILNSFMNLYWLWRLSR